MSGGALFFDVHTLSRLTCALVQMAAEFVLLGRTVSAVDARDKFRLCVRLYRLARSHPLTPHPRTPSVNAVVSAGDVLRTALAWAAEIARNSPDAVQSSKRALMHVADAPGVEDAFLRHVLGEESKRVYDGENIQEGINAFSEVRYAGSRRGLDADCDIGRIETPAELEGTGETVMARRCASSA